jgi:hypothetical protein
VNSFRSYLSNRKSQVRVSDILSSPLEVDPDVPHGFVLSCVVFVNDLCDAIAHSKYLLFADDIKIYRATKFPEGCYLLQSDINSIHDWSTANYMKLNISKIKVISLSREIRQSSITRTGSLKDLGIFTDTKLHLRNHVNHIFSRCIKV